MTSYVHEYRDAYEAEPEDITAYVSGPMTDMPEYNFPAFNEAAGRLREQGYEVSNPADRGVIDGWSWSDYLRVDLIDLVMCDAIFMLPGWQQSKGARLERHVAEQLGMAIWGATA